MKKGVAIPYIIALILGIVVVGVIGYWFFILSGGGGGKATEAECNVKASNWCRTWANSAWTSVPKKFDGTDYTWDEFAPGCSDIRITEPQRPYCEQLLGFTTTTTTG